MTLPTAPQIRIRKSKINGVCVAEQGRKFQRVKVPLWQGRLTFSGTTFSILISNINGQTLYGKDVIKQR